MATRSANTFEKKFKPRWKNDDHEPLSYTEFSSDILDLSVDSGRSQMWTLVDPMVSSGMQYWIPGYHMVNRVGFITTEVPWTEKDLADEYRRW